MCEAQHGCLRWRPVRPRQPQAVKEALNLLQCCIFCILSGRTHQSNHSCLGSNSFRNGRGLWGIRGCDGNGIDKLDMWHSLLQEQAPTRQYFNPYCSSTHLQPFLFFQYYNIRFSLFYHILSEGFIFLLIQCLPLLRDFTVRNTIEVYLLLVIYKI